MTVKFVPVLPDAQVAAIPVEELPAEVVTEEPVDTVPAPDVVVVEEVEFDTVLAPMHPVFGTGAVIVDFK